MPHHQTEDRHAERAEARLASLHRIEYLLGGLLVLFFFWSISLAKVVMLPIVLGFLIALTLSAPTRWIAKRGVPVGVTAVVLIGAIGLSTVTGLYMLRGPAEQLMRSIPAMQDDLREKLGSLATQVKQVREASEQMEDMAGGGADAKTTVVMDRASIVDTAISSLAGTGTALVIALILAMFLLASGDMFQRKLVQSFPRIGDKKRALRITHDVERQISRYLAAITVINAALGLAVGVSMYLLDMPYAHIWGVAAFLLNYLPYLGAMVGAVAVAAVAMVTFATLGQALVVPLVYLILTSIEGQMVTPWLVGRHLRLNAAAIFVAVIFWAWLWGVAGALMAVPFLVFVKVICDYVPGLKAIGLFLDGETRGRLREPGPSGAAARRSEREVMPPPEHRSEDRTDTPGPPRPGVIG
ncbi:AI-2E family transporter [Pseudooceanicola aestuarii]|uniref:AI-2E family transporter n=1 Tax=Pseudooceanicola aestuarii TaxID=2697319 RepID=UPI001EF95DDE|nr:AI-2E family transporter [Pseudooceanicola aestuarii]